MHAHVILAAGQGTRMRSRLPKVLHPLLGKPMLAYAVETALALNPAKLVVVVGHGKEKVLEALEGYPVEVAFQEEQLGTAHALLQAEPFLRDFPGPTLVTQGDTPLLSPSTLGGLLERVGEGAGMALLTVELSDPTGYGRILRQGEEVLGSVEEKDATPEVRAIREVNAGAYAFDPFLFRALKEVRNENAAREYYLPDLIAIYRAHGKRVAAVRGAAEEALGVNTREELARVEGILLARLRAEWMRRGVRMILPESVYLEPSVELAPDVTLWPGVVLKGKTRIGEGAEVGPYALLEDTVLEPGARVLGHTVAQGAVIAGGADAGPFARLRPGAVLREGVHVGNFVEVKNSLLHPGVKAGHLAYLGDAEVGEGANIGAGVITANYDGKRKHRTWIGKGAFIGSNAVLVAPVRVGDGAMVGAGSVITQDVPEEALAVARGRQRNLEGYARRKREGG
ncbi:MAG: bifunctional UDP-N-acetylglucosamine diphosphorylase/glucosamine-1-phosphate N-acetyltransferase GlmU [Thermus sp.]|uniref:bifunctional UDP-N-acetylglucosamine diphosphorylase/glucosamine-1-phosphate N-acetyltransferase GlmU n=1 Tax=Thermus sp. TaxID=275 RepID=UPI0025CFC738|nr:bifunctional UDP-N-acetylglucosamine diphosphorylase/glucosamine-1-phosphate N-acetyltransferase GlmU [Thermus sp.]MCS7218658.1 bifunctional UDP-N-acetylglucosamine diphosphorylase/glucosamine-1-phosphate N-acetyltransferase GlmU [Thermus sp.]